MAIWAKRWTSLQVTDPWLYYRVTGGQKWKHVGFIVEDDTLSEPYTAVLERSDDTVLSTGVFCGSPVAETTVFVRQ